MRMVEKSPTQCNLQTRGVCSRKRRRERDENLSQIFMKKKGTPTPPYIGQGGGQPPSTSHVGLFPRGGGWPPSWRHGPWGRTPSPPNGPFYSLFNYLNPIFNI